MRNKKGFLTIPSGKSLKDALQQNARPSSLEFLPGQYPFWTRHAVFTGMTYLDYDTTVLSRVDVVISLDDADIKFQNTPLILSWLRDADSALNYTNTTPIYRFPIVRRNSSTGVEQESFNNGFFVENGSLYFVRHGINTFGSAGTTRTYIKFFLFDDDAFLNIDESVVYDV